MWAEKSGGESGTKAKCHRKCARTKEEVSRTKVGQRKEVKPQNNLDCSVCVCVESTVEFTVDPFDFQSTKVVHLGFLKVLLGVLFLRDIFKCSEYKEHLLMLQGTFQCSQGKK